MNFVGRFEPTQPVLANRQQIRRGQSRPVAKLYRRADRFPVTLAGTAKGRRLDDIGMRIQRFVDFARGDVFTALDDQFLQTPGDKDVTVCVHTPQITRTQPAAGGKAVRRRLGIVEVFEHHIRPANDQFAFDTTGHRLHGGVKDRDFVPIGDPRRADLADTRRQRVRQDLRGGFGQPHGLDNRYPEPVLERPLHIRGQRRRGRAAKPDTRLGGRIGIVFRMEKMRDDCRNHREPGGT